MTERNLYLEDIEVGQTWVGEPIEITQAELIVFALQYDPQPFHTDPQAAAASPFGGLIARGWHVAALGMKQFVEMRPFGATPLLGMGVDQLRWLKPVRPGDRVVFRREVVEVTRSKSRPDRGVVAVALEARNQDGEVVMRAVTRAQAPARPVQTEEPPRPA